MPRWRTTQDRKTPSLSGTVSSPQVSMPAAKWELTPGGRWKAAPPYSHSADRHNLGCYGRGGWVKHHAIVLDINPRLWISDNRRRQHLRKVAAKEAELAIARSKLLAKCGPPHGCRAAQGMQPVG